MWGIHVIPCFGWTFFGYCGSFNCLWICAFVKLPTLKCLGVRFNGYLFSFFVSLKQQRPKPAFTLRQLESAPFQIQMINTTAIKIILIQRCWGTFFNAELSILVLTLMVWLTFYCCQFYSCFWRSNFEKGLLNKLIYDWKDTWCKVWFEFHLSCDWEDCLPVWGRTLQPACQSKVVSLRQMRC